MTAKEQKQLIIVGILLIILVAAGYNSFSSLSKTGASRHSVPAAASVPATPASVPVPAAHAADEGKIALQKARSEKPWGRDPFAGLGGRTEERLDSFKLQGITLGKGTGFAFINNTIMKKGDQLGSYKIADVLKNKVLLQKGEQKIYLTFPETK